MPDQMTIGDVARTFGEPEWKIRRIVDALAADLPRVGEDRVAPRSLLPEIGADRRRLW